jgi:hypothetical protein
VSPYRSPAPKPTPEENARDADLLVPYAVVWAAALVHLGFAFVRATSWSAGTTLTAILAVWIPWALRATIAERWRSFLKRRR